nr:hypothetical protein [Tanacetum cinerariifolium]
MADVNVNAPADQAPTMAPPTRTNDQILPHIRWVPIGKSNCYLDVEKLQSNPIFKIAFWDTVRYDKTAGCYKCQQDEQWFDLTEDTLRDAHQITPVNNNKAFSSPPSSDALINFVNELGYPKLIKNLSNRKHKFHPRPDSSLHLPNEEHVLGYLKFSAKGTKREVFGMPIPGNLIIADIHSESYYQEYVAKVAKHQRYLPSETGSDPESPEPKPTKATKKSKPSVPKAALRPPIIKPASSQQPEPQPAPAKEKGKEKVTDEQVARDPLTLQTLKKKSPVDRYIFQRRTSTPTGSFGHDESSSLYAELGLIDSPVIHAGPNLEHMDLEVIDVSTQPHPKKIDERFTATAYPKVQENLKLTVEEHMILEEPASSTRTLSSLQHLTKDLSFGDMFFNDKPLEVDNEKTNAETKAESMVSVTIQQDTSSIPPMTTSVIDLTSRPESPNVHQPLQATASETTTTTTIHLPPSQPQQSTTDSMLVKRIDELEHIMANLIQENKHLEYMLDSHGARL